MLCMFLTGCKKKMVITFKMEFKEKIEWIIGEKLVFSPIV